jgi:hypothetical protein
MAPKRKQKGRRPMNRQNGNLPRGSRTPTTHVWNIMSQRSPNLSNLMSGDNKVYSVSQMVEFGGILNSSNLGANSNGLAFSFGQVPQNSTWASVFDQYRIDEIELWIQPTQLLSTTVDSFRWYSVIDYDDDGVSTTEAAALAFQNVSDCGRFEGVYRRFRPHIAIAVAQSGGAPTARNAPSNWLDAGSTSIKHYALKVVTQSTATQVIISLRARFHLSFRNVF